jgi:hypothetical protein
MALRYPQTYVDACRTVPDFRSIGQITLSGYGVNQGREGKKRCGVVLTLSKLILIVDPEITEKERRARGQLVGNTRSLARGAVKEPF